jgi:hypothetical protein
MLLRTTTFAVTLLSLSACAVDDLAEGELAEVEGPVIHGSITPEGMFPATGALLYDQGGGSYAFGCTGTLVAPDVVLTAAHCLYDLISGPGVPAFTLKSDARALLSTDIVPGRAKFPHPQFDLAGANQLSAPAVINDIGILRLATPITTVEPEYLASVEEAEGIVVDVPVDIVGYGLTDPNLQIAGVKENATSVLTMIGTHEVYVGNPGDAQNCNGDSGGPAYAAVGVGGARRLVGIVSRGQPGCAEGGLDTRPEAYRDWINQTLAASCEGSESCELPLPSTPDPGGDDGGGCGCRVGARSGAAHMSSAGLGLLGLGIVSLALVGMRGRKRRRA